MVFAKASLPGLTSLSTIGLILFSQPMAVRFVNEIDVMKPSELELMPRSHRLMRWIDRAIGVISTLVLARILVPDDFGIVAMASVVVAFVDEGVATATECGVEAEGALIPQRPVVSSR